MKEFDPEKASGILHQKSCSNVNITVSLIMLNKLSAENNQLQGVFTLG
jgi:hypothetical protein